MLTMKDVIREGHPTLLKKSSVVSLPLDDKTKETLKAMRTFLINSQDPDMVEKYDLRPGVGLAAPQINIPLRMIAIYAEDENYEEHYDLLLINPKIVGHSIEKTYMPGGEGCLSIDREVDGLVPRHKKVTVRTHVYNTETDTLEQVTLKFKGFLSIVFQHELDHLDGILFPSRVVKALPDIEPVKFKSLVKNEEEQA